MSFTWSDKLITGNQLVDSQHKELFRAANELLDACKSGRGQEKLDAAMKFLVDYTHKHFGDEEKLQQQCHYPDAANHKKLHEYFKSSMEDLAKKLKVEGPTSMITTTLSSTLGNWLINHILTEDKKYIPYTKG